MDQHARLPIESRLVRSRERDPPLGRRWSTCESQFDMQLEEAGVKVIRVGPIHESGCQTSCDRSNFYKHSLTEMLRECGPAQLYERHARGGAKLLGQAFDSDALIRLSASSPPKSLGTAMPL